ncbi:flagellar hook-length control protein FliK [Pseudoalteromonas aliena]|uniref:flagellar hook-length control protein FliK n=1 Tax=Pseudoalteromonas aliena TaxID=247523 RepID=UPI00311F490B
MNIQVGNGAPKTEFEGVNSKRVIANAATSEDAEVQGKEFNEHTLASQKEMGEGNTTNDVADYEASGDEYVSTESAELDEKRESHYLLNPIQKPKSVEHIVNLQGLVGVEQDLSNVEEGLSSEPLIDGDLLDSPVVKSSTEFTQVVDSTARALGMTQTSDVIPNTLKKDSFSNELSLNINKVSSSSNSRFTPETSSLMPQSISADLNVLVNKSNTSNEVVLPLVSQTLQSPTFQGQLRTIASQPNVDNNIALADISAEQVVTHKSELAKHSVNALSGGSFNIESRDFLNNKTQLLSPITNNGSLVDTFEWRQEKLKGSPNEWGQRLLNVLGDKVNLQIGQQVQRAQIRLDPPHLGRIEISINVDGDKTSVNLVTSNPQVRDAIAQTLDQLRQTLSQNGSVSVDLSFSDKQQEQNHNSEGENIAENFTFTDNSETDVTKEQKSSTDWLNRLV